MACPDALAYPAAWASPAALAYPAAWAYQAAFACQAASSGAVAAHKAVRDRVGHKLDRVVAVQLVVDSRRSPEAARGQQGHNQLLFKQKHTEQSMQEYFAKYTYTDNSKTVVTGNISTDDTQFHTYSLLYF